MYVRTYMEVYSGNIFTDKPSIMFSRFTYVLRSHTVVKNSKKNTS